MVQVLQHKGSRTRALLASCHPEPTVAVTAVAGLLAVVAGRGAASLWVLGAVLTGQLSIGWLNDAVDAARDRAAGREDKPVARGELSTRTVGAAAVVAAVVSVPLAVAAGWNGQSAVGVTLGLHLLVVGGGWVYDLGVKSTVLSVLPYAVAFGALPAFVVAPVATVPWWLVAAGALLGSGAHFANVLPDLAADAATGVRGLPHVLGARGSVTATVVLLLAASVLLVLGPQNLPWVVGAAALVTAVVAVGVGLLTSLGLFRAVVWVALVDVVLLVLSGSALR
ncbi:UbiA family prenyltransferase [Rhodococcus sp. X156]|uniref:UbiA family prenyltransferase n=1 Tax=Rhodococcus sp. X156 TaxID=2499145 RepID=UPI001F49C74D|nr:UbiA family prenyltransferase [Rhodococcus sp. X156]